MRRSMYSLPGLNWTKVGLKVILNREKFVTLCSLNWTKVGLKARAVSARTYSPHSFELD